jgi:hypothetical protein
VSSEKRAKSRGEREEVSETRVSGDGGIIKLHGTVKVLLLVIVA